MKFKHLKTGKLLIFAVLFLLLLNGCASKRDMPSKTNMLHVPSRGQGTFLGTSKTEYSLSLMDPVDSRSPGKEKDKIDKWLDKPVSKIVFDNLRNKIISAGLFKSVTAGGYGDYVLRTRIIDFTAPVDEGFTKVEMTTNVKLFCKLIDNNTGITIWEGQVSGSQTSGERVLITWDWTGQAFLESLNQAVDQIIITIASLIDNKTLVSRDEAIYTSGKTIIHWKIDSEPQGAVILYSIVSQTNEIPSTMEMYLDRTPLEITQPAVLNDLPKSSYHLITIVIIAKKEGYYSQRKEINMKAIANQSRLGLFFELVKK